MRKWSKMSRSKSSRQKNPMPQDLFFFPEDRDGLPAESLSWAICVSDLTHSGSKNPSDFEDRPEHGTGPGWGSGCWSQLIYDPNIPRMFVDIRNNHYILGGIYLYIYILFRNMIPIL